MTSQKAVITLKKEETRVKQIYRPRWKSMIGKNSLTDSSFVDTGSAENVS